MDFAEALRLAELAKHHCHELVPAAQTAGMAFPVVLGYHLFKQPARYLLENLAKNAGYSCQGLVLGWLDFVLGGTYPTLTGRCLFFREC